MADRESGIYFEILHMEYRAGTSEFGKKTGGRDKNVGSMHKTMSGRFVTIFQRAARADVRPKLSGARRRQIPRISARSSSRQRRILTPVRISLA